MTLITGILYPLLITSIGRLIWTEKSLGSLLRTHNENIIGSSLIGQNFTSLEYFWPPPSASNLGPASNNFKNLINIRRQSSSLLYNTNSSNIPDSLITSSASGLDPHIILSALRFQIARVKQARALTKTQEDEFAALIQKKLEQPWLTAQKEPYQNVLVLNLALDRSFGKISK